MYPNVWFSEFRSSIVYYCTTTKLAESHVISSNVKKSADLFVRRGWQIIFQILHEEKREQDQKETISYCYPPPLSIAHVHITLLLPERKPAPSFLQDLRIYSFFEKTCTMPKSIFYVKNQKIFFSFNNTNLCDYFLLVHSFNRGFHPSEFSRLIIIFILGLSMSTNLVVR